MITKNTILEQAIHECMRELYAKAQPVADWDNILEECRQGKIKKDERIYERHYLSPEEFSYIVNKYVDAYRLNNKWIENIELLESYLMEGGHKDKYIKEEIDEDGFRHPGYRSYEDVPPLKDHIKNMITDDFIAQKITDKVMELISTCKNFYRRNIDEEKFRVSVTFGASPCGNPETVKKWWKENYNYDLEIEERNPLLLWEMDYYGDEFESVMEEEYGENWKSEWDAKYEEQKAKELAEHQKRMEELQKKMENEDK